MKLVNEETLQTIELGSKLETFRGEKCTLLSGTPPHKPSSTGRVYVEFEDGTKGEYFPSVIGLKWVE